MSRGGAERAEKIVKTEHCNWPSAVTAAPRDQVFQISNCFRASLGVGMAGAPISPGDVSVSVRVGADSREAPRIARQVDDVVACRQSCARRPEELTLLGKVDQRAKSLELRRHHSSAEWGQSEVSPSLVVTVTSTARCDIDQRLGVKTTDMPVQIARLDFDGVARVVDDRLSNGVPVKRRLGEHGEHEELEGTKREELLWSGLGNRHAMARVDPLLSL